MLSTDEKERALIRAVSTLPPDAPQHAIMARMLITLDAIRRAEDEEKPPEQKQEWGRVSQVAKHFGVTPGAVEKWVAPLIRDDVVHIIKPAGGWTLYNIPEIERAFAVDAPAGGRCAMPRTQKRR